MSRRAALGGPFVVSGVLLLLGWAVPVGGTLSWVVSLGLLGSGVLLTLEAKLGFSVLGTLRTKMRG